jgi:O-antigen ligase
MTITFLIFEKKKIYILGIIPMIIALVWSSTRSVWIGFVIVLLFLAFLKEKRILILFICLLIIFVLFSILLPQTKVIERVGSIFNIEYQTNKERIAMWAHGIKIMKDYPLGIGVHNVDKVYPLYKKEEEKNQAHLHNNFIQIGVERGILGLICFIWLIIHAIAILTYSYFHSKNEKSKMILLSILVSFIFFIITGFTEYNFGTSRVIMLIWFLLGIGIKLCENSLK